MYKMMSVAWRMQMNNRMIDKKPEKPQLIYSEM